MESKVLVLEHSPQRNGMRKMQFCPHLASNLKEEQSRYHSGVSPAPRAFFLFFMVLLKTTHFYFLKDLFVLFLITRIWVSICASEDRYLWKPEATGPLELVIQAVVSCLRGCCKSTSGPLNEQSHRSRGPSPHILSSVRLDIVLPLSTARTPKVPTVLGYSKLRTFLVCVCVCFI